MKLKYIEFFRVSRELIYRELSAFGKDASPNFGAVYGIESETKVYILLFTGMTPIAVLSASSRFILGVGTEDGFDPAEGRCENLGCNGCPLNF